MKQYMHPTSCHPPCVVKSIRYRQALCIKHICSNPNDFDDELKNLPSFFKNRIYNMKHIEDAIKKSEGRQNLSEINQWFTHCGDDSFLSANY